MSSADSDSARTSDTTSSSALTNAKPTELTEAQYLQQQAELAKQAISRAASDIAAKLGKGASPAQWTREYPWISLGAAAVAGFVAANALIPSKEQQALRKLAALERAIHPPPPVVEATTTDKEENKHGMLYGIAKQALQALQPVLISAITAQVARHGPSNGRPAAADPASGPVTPPA